MDNLDFCPFCGGEAEIKQRVSTDSIGNVYKNWIVYCRECGVNKVFSIKCDQDDAISWWNKRVKTRCHCYDDCEFRLLYNASCDNCAYYIPVIVKEGQDG